MIDHVAIADATRSFLVLQFRPTGQWLGKNEAGVLGLQDQPCYWPMTSDAHWAGMASCRIDVGDHVPAGPYLLGYAATDGGSIKCAWDVAWDEPVEKQSITITF